MFYARNPGPGGQCGALTAGGVAGWEAYAWAIDNARSVHSSSGLKIGKFSREIFWFKALAHYN